MAKCWGTSPTNVPRFAPLTRPVCAVRTTEVKFPDVVTWLLPFPMFIHSWCLVGSMTALESLNALLCSLLMSLCVWGVEGGGGNVSEVCEMKLLWKSVRPRKVSNYERKSVASLLVFELQTYSCTWHVRTHVCSIHYPLLKPGITKLPSVAVSALLFQQTTQIMRV
jgi:hypothetical protein